MWKKTIMDRDLEGWVGIILKISHDDDSTTCRAKGAQERTCENEPAILTDSTHQERGDGTGYAWGKGHAVQHLPSRWAEKAQEVSQDGAQDTVPSRRIVDRGSSGRSWTWYINKGESPFRVCLSSRHATPAPPRDRKRSPRPVSVLQATTDPPPRAHRSPHCVGLSGHCDPPAVGHGTPSFVPLSIAFKSLQPNMSSSYASSVLSSTGTMAAYAKKLALQGRPDMEIHLDGHTPGKIYATFDALSGRVEITAPHNARFDEIQITLEGSVKTYLERMSPATAHSRTTATHHFLKLVMPIRQSEYPHPRIAETGTTYRFPFNFVIPDQLLPTACTHKCLAEHVHEAHLQLPPSMGDRDVSEVDDFAPDMSKVQYAIKVKVVRNREQDGKEITLVEGLRKLHIVPAVPVAPPMSIGDGDQNYVLSKSKSLKKGVFSGKLGRITVSADQTNAIVLPAPSRGTSPETIMANVNLRFDPHDPSSKPPRLGGLTSKLKATTFFAARPAQRLPSRSDIDAEFDPYRGAYTCTIPLSSRCVESVSWTKHDPEISLSRRGSDMSMSSSDESDHLLKPEIKKSSIYYTATILAPITLPTSKAWLPTFHSCIVSRIYSLDFSLSVHTPGTGVPASRISLRLPVQIASQGNQTRSGVLNAVEAAAELADADEYLRPRVIEVPRADLVENSVLGRSDPPSYEDFAEPQRQVVAC
ncbi:hypothetical protein B7494_g4191 [Chlorociboria aeruginascens]|nr:hypothetical protein B7494_g4191 [Chlorociboria aeruginascens]